VQRGVNLSGRGRLVWFLCGGKQLGQSRICEQYYGGPLAVDASGLARYDQTTTTEIARQLADSNTPRRIIGWVALDGSRNVRYKRISNGG
jgi:hypothetical protein